MGRAGVGIDNVDLAAATEAGVLVVNAPTANTIAAAEHGIALLCSLSRNVAQADASMKVGATQLTEFVCAVLSVSASAAPQVLTADCHAKQLQNGEWKRTKYVGTSLVDKTLAVIGFGKARCARAASPGPPQRWRVLC